MYYLLFDVLAVAAPALLLLRGRPDRSVLWGPALALAAAALLWTAPWDDYLVRSGIWSYAHDAVLARVGAVPVEEYAFVVLEALLVGAWSLHTGALHPDGGAGGTRRGAWAWAGVALAGCLLILLGGHLRYLGLLLVWAGPPLALQHAVAGDVLAARRGVRLRTALPVALWLCLSDRVALAAGIWAISPGSSTGADVLGLPVEEALFFGLTCLLVTDGLLLAADGRVRARVLSGVRRTVRA